MLLVVRRWLGRPHLSQLACVCVVDTHSARELPTKFCDLTEVSSSSGWLRLFRAFACGAGGGDTH